MPVYHPPTRPCSHDGPGAENLMDAIMDVADQRWPGAYDLGIYNCRTVAGTVAPSAHGNDRAGDVGFPLVNGAPNPRGAVLASELVSEADRLGLQAVVWNRSCWGFGRWYWRTYSGENPHIDHVHWELNVYGAERLTYTNARNLLVGEAPPPDPTIPHQPIRRRDVAQFFVKCPEHNALWLTDFKTRRHISSTEVDLVDFLAAENDKNHPVVMSMSDLSHIRIVGATNANSLPAYDGSL